MSKKITSVVLVLCMLFSCVAVGTFISNAVTVDNETVSASTDAQSSIQGGAVLHCFDWSYNSIKANLKDIKDAGYTAVQTSPVLTPKDYNASWTDQKGQWWKLYQPISISIADGNSWLGTKAELKSMCDEAEKLGIKVIVDIVANHMADVDGSGNTASNINSNVESTIRNNSSYWHLNGLWADDDNNREHITQGSIGQPDLNTGNSYIQQRYKDVLIELIGLGVDGFRFDAAKHIELPTDGSYGSQFWPTVINGSQASTSNEIYYYGEILNGAGTSISNYTKYMSITDNYSSDLALVSANNGNASGLANSNYSKGAGANKTVSWVESHDTYMGNSGSAGLKNTSGVSDSTITKTWAIVGSRANSTSLFFARPATTMGAASTDTTWKSDAVKEVNKFKNYFDGETEYLASEGGVAYNERGTSGVVISKLSGSDTVSLTAHKMANGTYKDQISGNTFTVANGKISGTVGSTGVAVVYNNVVEPKATVTPGSTSYKTDTLELTLNYTNATSGSYSIDGGSYTNFTDGKKITIGSGLAYGTKTTVTVKATDGSKTSEPVTYTYTKTDPSDVQMVYFDNSSYNWSKVYAYIYKASGTGHIENAAWPGQEMTYNSSTKLYELEVPEELSDGMVMFTESYSATTNRYPADGEDGLLLNGKSMLFKANHVWVEYDGPIPTQPTTSVQPTTAQPTTAQPTTAPIGKVLIGDVNLDGRITVDDATEAQRYLADMISLSSKALIAADTDGLNGTDITDVTRIMFYLVGLTAQSGKCGQYYGDEVETTVPPTTAQPTTAQPTTAQPTTSGSDKYTMTLTNNYNWSSVYCYYWSDSNTKMVVWPGTAMTKSGTNDYGQSIYTIEIPSDAEYVIFNNGSGTQTVNIPITGSAKYYISGGSGTSCEVKTW